MPVEKILCLIGLPALLGWALTGLMTRYLETSGIVDVPGKNSAHKKPIPTGAGLAIMAVILPGWLLIAHFNNRPEFFTIFAAGVMLTIVSWLDDRRHLPILPRFGAHLAAVALGLATFPDTQMLFQGFLPFWADRLLMGLLWLWFLNLYNFMDGMDGMAGVQTLCIVAGLLLICAMFPTAKTPEYAAYALLLAGTAAGFLVWNRPPAKVFMGDVGSITIGFLLGWLMLTVALHGFRTSVLILPGYYWGDATLTLLKRMIRRERFWEGHKQHWFHRALARGMTPDQMLLRVVLFNIVLAALAVMAVLGQTPLLKFKILVLAGLLTLVFLRALDSYGKKPG